MCPKIREWPIGHISPTGDPIYFMFGSRVGFQGQLIEWRYFRLHQIQVGGRPPSWIISNSHISATAHSIHLHIAHRAVIFAIAQLSCRFKLHQHQWVQLPLSLRQAHPVHSSNSPRLAHFTSSFPTLSIHAS